MKPLLFTRKKRDFNIDTWRDLAIKVFGHQIHAPPLDSRTCSYLHTVGRSSRGPRHRAVGGARDNSPDFRVSGCVLHHGRSCVGGHEEAVRRRRSAGAAQLAEKSGSLLPPGARARTRALSLATAQSERAFPLGQRTRCMRG